LRPRRSFGSVTRTPLRSGPVAEARGRGPLSAGATAKLVRSRRAQIRSVRSRRPRPSSEPRGVAKQTSARSVPSWRWSTPRSRNGPGGSSLTDPSRSCLVLARQSRQVRADPPTNRRRSWSRRRYWSQRSNPDGGELSCSRASPSCSARSSAASSATGTRCRGRRWKLGQRYSLPRHLLPGPSRVPRRGRESGLLTASRKQAFGLRK